MFNVGDKVKIKTYCSGASPDRVYELTRGSDGDLFTFEWVGGHRKTGCSCRGNWLLVGSAPIPKVPLYKVTGITKFLETTLRS